MKKIRPLCSEDEEQDFYATDEPFVSLEVGTGIVTVKPPEGEKWTLEHAQKASQKMMNLLFGGVIDGDFDG